MAGTWIRVDATLPDHPRICLTAHLLHVSMDGMVGKMLRLWQWALETHPDGFIPEYEMALVRRVMGTRKGRHALFEALCAVPHDYERGFLYATDGGYQINDWEEYTGAYYTSQREKESDRDRKRGKQARKTPDRGRMLPINAKAEPEIPAENAESKPEIPAETAYENAGFEAEPTGNSAGNSLARDNVLRLTKDVETFEYANTDVQQDSIPVDLGRNEGTPQLLNAGAGAREQAKIESCVSMYTDHYRRMCAGISGQKAAHTKFQTAEMTKKMRSGEWSVDQVWWSLEYLKKRMENSRVKRPYAYMNALICDWIERGLRTCDEIAAARTMWEDAEEGA